VKPTVFITGADKGLGYCLVSRFLRGNYRVFAGYLDNGAQLRSLESAHGDDLICVPQDVTSVTSIRTSADRVAALTPSLDVLINCAGVCYGETHKKILESDFINGRLEQTMAVNAFGPLRVTQALLPLIEKGSLKKIANISSEAGSIGENWRDFGYAYCMSKAALNMQSVILQKDVGARGIKVYVFHPGWMRTDMGRPDAHISPETAAEGIFAQMHKPCAIEDPMYMDYTGRLFKW